MDDGAAYPPVNVLRLLVRQQALIHDLLLRYRGARRGLSARDAQTLTRSFCTAIAVHLHLQEEILYPAARELLADDRLVDSLEAEQRDIRPLLAALCPDPGAEPLGGIRLAELSERLDRLFEHEQTRLFPRLDDMGLDLRGLGQQLLGRQRQLLDAADRDPALLFDRPGPGPLH